MSLIDTLQWRYACKKFDPQKTVAGSDLDFIKEAIRLSASSFGLQLYKVIIIEDRALREKLKPHSWGQDKVVDASQLFVFTHYTKISDEILQEYALRRSRIQGKSLDEGMPYIHYIREKLGSYDPEHFSQWASKQCYLALGNLLAACGEKQIDSCPIEGFEKEAYDRILGLEALNLSTSVLAAVGYRASDDANQFVPKVRRDLDDLFVIN